MTPEQFAALPAAVRLDVLYEALRDRLASMPVPGVSAPSTSRPVQHEPVRQPKFDAKLPRRGGYVFMSEMLVADLEWWAGKKRESVESGSQYATKDAKTLAELERWIVWRTQCPGDAWTGIRGEARVVAAVPARDPELHAWGDRGPAKLATQPDDYESTSGGNGFSDADYGTVDDEEIPF